MSLSAQAEHGLSRTIIRNTIYNSIGKLWGILVAVFLTPYIVHSIGIERFSIWAIVGVVTGYFGMLDFGIGMSFVKYIAEFYAKKDFRKLNEVINSGLFFNLALAAIIIAIMSLYIRFLPGFFRIPQHLYNESVFAFFIGIIIFCVSNALSIFLAIQSGLQRMDITNRLGIIMSLPTVAGTIYVLQHGYGLRGLMINNAIIFTISSAASIVIAFKILPQLKVSPFLFSRDMFKKLFGFGIKLQVARMASLIAVNIDKLLIARFLPIGLVTFFQLGSSVVDQAKSVGLLFMGALIPAFSQLEVTCGRSELVDGYIRGTKYLALMTIPLNAFIIFFAHQIMFIWMGAGYEGSARVIQILGVGWGFAILCGMRAIMVQVIARTDIEMKAGLIAVLLNIPLSIILISKFGFLGVALGTSIAVIISGIYGFLELHKVIKLPLIYFIRRTILSTAFICICTGMLVRVVSNASYGLFKLDRTATMIVFIVEALLFFGIYMGVMLCVKPFDGVDLARLSINKAGFLKELLRRFSRT